MISLRGRERGTQVLTMISESNTISRELHCPLARHSPDTPAVEQDDPVDFFRSLGQDEEEPVPIHQVNCCRKKATVGTCFCKVARAVDSAAHLRRGSVTAG